MDMGLLNDTQSTIQGGKIMGNSKELDQHNINLIVQAKRKLDIELQLLRVQFNQFKKKYKQKCLQLEQIQQENIKLKDQMKTATNQIYDINRKYTSTISQISSTISQISMEKNAIMEQHFIKLNQHNVLLERHVQQKMELHNDIWRLTRGQLVQQLQSLKKLQQRELEFYVEQSKQNLRLHLQKSQIEQLENSLKEKQQELKMIKLEYEILKENEEKLMKVNQQLTVQFKQTKQKLEEEKQNAQRNVFRLETDKMDLKHQVQNRNDLITQLEKTFNQEKHEIKSNFERIIHNNTYEWDKKRIKSEGAIEKLQMELSFANQMIGCLSFEIQLLHQSNVENPQQNH